MNPIVKTKWIAALRSGDYAQGKGSLHRGGKYCCLGVLCDLYRKEHPEAHWNDDKFVTKNEQRGGFLPWDVVQWAGLAETDPFIDSQGESLSYLNDRGNNKTFPEIATLIEENL